MCVYLGKPNHGHDTKHLRHRHIMSIEKYYMFHVMYQWKGVTTNFHVKIGGCVTCGDVSKDGFYARKINHFPLRPRFYYIM